MITVNTNVNGLKLQRNLNSVNSAMQKALNRISTGYKINNASDDAAGMVISKALETQTRGLNVANQNANMATNLLQTADGALSQIGDLTMRIRDLATQSANGTYSEKERAALELEAKELTNSLEQLVKGTKFNEYDIFTPSSKTTKGITTEEEAIAQGYEIVKTAEELKAVLNAPDALNNTNKKVMLFADINLDELGIDATGSNWEAIGASTGANFRGTFDGNGFVVSNLKIEGSDDYQGFFGILVNATVKNFGLENANVNGGNDVGILTGSAGDATISNCFTTGRVGGGGINIGGLIGNTSGNQTTISNCYAKSNVSGKSSVGGLIGEMDSVSGSVENCYATGNVFSISSGSNFVLGGLIGKAGSFYLSNSYSTGQVFAQTNTGGGYIGEVSGRLALHDYEYAEQLNGAANYNGIGTISGTIVGIQQYTGRDPSWFGTPSNIEPILNVGMGANQWDYTTMPPKLKWQTAIPKPSVNNFINFQIGTDGSALSAITMDLAFSLNGFKPDFSTAETSRATMQQCDALLKNVNTKRGEIGANTNIIASIVEGNTSLNENLTASKSRIQDADIARESANMVKNQILEQATASLITQSSNMNGQLALNLLMGLGGRR